MISQGALAPRDVIFLLNPESLSRNVSGITILSFEFAAILENLVKFHSLLILGVIYLNF